MAAKIGDSAAIKIILNARKILIAARDNQDQTPLHKAAFLGHFGCVQILLESNSDVSATDKVYIFI